MSEDGKPKTAESKEIEILREVCPHLIPEDGSLPSLCCSLKQLKDIKTNFEYPKNLLGKTCPTCYHNFKKVDHNSIILIQSGVTKCFIEFLRHHLSSATEQLRPSGRDCDGSGGRGVQGPAEEHGQVRHVLYQRGVQRRHLQIL